LSAPRPPISVVVCTKNEEARLEDCLRAIRTNAPDEVIVVDGGSTDRTLDIARALADRVIASPRSNLTLDRQRGIDAARNELIAMIDADHRLAVGDLDNLHADLIHFGLDIVQSQLASFKNRGFWDAAEEQSWDLTHNIPGPRSMIGTAPAIFRRRVFERVRFDDTVTSAIDDTDFMYRLSKFPELRIGIGTTRIAQLHFSDFDTYRRKFRWYGRGDGQFCLKNPERAPSMCFHLLVRYPIVYSARAVRRGKLRAVPFFVMQGWLRFASLVTTVARGG
jgi:glycosyltransferase involved in cell wall biosynthesis